MSIAQICIDETTLKQLGFVPEQITKLDHLLRTKKGKLILPTGRKCKATLYSPQVVIDSTILKGLQWGSAALKIFQLLHHCGLLYNQFLQHVQLGVEGLDAYIWKDKTPHQRYGDTHISKFVHAIFGELSLDKENKLLLDIIPAKGNNVSPASDSELAIQQMEAKTLELWNQAENVRLEWHQEFLDPYIEHLWYEGLFFGTKQNIHIIKYNQSAPHLSMVISKTSESHRPMEPLNFLGSAHPLKQVLEEQPDAIIGINGTYFDYTHTYYPIDSGSHVGDPVLPTIIREHVWSPPIPTDSKFNYLVQTEKKSPFKIIDFQEVNALSCKPQYMLSCSPALIMKGKFVTIRETRAVPLPSGAVNPPGHLGHLFSQAARTVAASDDKNNLLFITVDGPASEKGTGMNFAQLLALMRIINVKEAANLDGGGSTALWCRRGQNHPPELINAQPSQEQNRDIGNALLIFNAHWPRKK